MKKIILLLILCFGFIQNTFADDLKIADVNSNSFFSPILDKNVISDDFIIDSITYNNARDKIGNSIHSFPSYNYSYTSILEINGIVGNLRIQTVDDYCYYNFDFITKSYSDEKLTAQLDGNFNGSCSDVKLGFMSERFVIYLNGTYYFLNAGVKNEGEYFDYESLSFDTFTPDYNLTSSFFSPAVPFHYYYNSVYYIDFNGKFYLKHTNTDGSLSTYSIDLDLGDLSNFKQFNIFRKNDLFYVSILDDNNNVITNKIGFVDGALVLEVLDDDYFYIWYNNYLNKGYRTNKDFFATRTLVDYRKQISIAGLSLSDEYLYYVNTDYELMRKGNNTLDDINFLTGNDTGTYSNSGSDSNVDLTVINDFFESDLSHNNLSYTGSETSNFSKFSNDYGNTFDNLNNNFSFSGVQEKLGVIKGNIDERLLLNENKTCKMFNDDGSFKSYGSLDISLNFNIMQGNKFDYFLIIPQKLINWITNPINNLLSLTSVFENFDDGQEICFLGFKEKVEFQKIFKQVNMGNATIIPNMENKDLIVIGKLTFIDYFVLVVFGLFITFGVIVIFSRLY